MLRVLASSLVCLSLLAGCATAPSPSGASMRPSPEPSADTSPEPKPISTPTPTSAPSGSPFVSTGFQYSDILRVEVNGLAVRVAPELGSALVQGIGLSGEPLGDVRLDAGDFVSVHLGPLPIGDTVWYQVWPAEDARLNYSTVGWDPGLPADIGGVGPGWVTASVGEDQNLALYRRPEPSEYESWSPGGPQMLMVSGTGDYESEPQAGTDLYAFDWAVALGDDLAPCAFSVTLQPEDGGEPVVAVETSTTGFTVGPGSGVVTPWGPTAGGSWTLFTVSIASGCTWAVLLRPLGHD
jgi:hypothetical protein